VLRGGRVIERDVPVDVIPVYAREAAMSGSQLDLPFEMS
jgi:hypothetical protein